MLMQVPCTYLQNAPRRLFATADPADRNEAAVNEQVDLILTALAFVEQRIDGSPWSAITCRSPIAGLFQSSNTITLLGVVHGRPDIIARHKKLASYCTVAPAEPTNARLIAEQVAGLPPGLQAFTKRQTSDSPLQAS